MRRFLRALFVFSLFTTLAAFAQSDYRVINVVDGGTISGNVKWSGPVPRALEFPVTKDAQVCDPDGKKTTDLERLIVGPNGGVANTVATSPRARQWTFPNSGDIWIRRPAATSLTFFWCRKMERSA